MRLQDRASATPCSWWPVWAATSTSVPRHAQWLEARASSPSTRAPRVILPPSAPTSQNMAPTLHARPPPPQPLPQLSDCDQRTNGPKPMGAPVPPRVPPPLTRRLAPTAPSAAGRRARTTRPWSSSGQTATTRPPPSRPNRNAPPAVCLSLSLYLTLSLSSSS